MKTVWVLTLTLGLLLASTLRSTQPAGPEWAVYFSPDGGATKAIEEEFFW
jgi:hypothetical protein